MLYYYKRFLAVSIHSAISKKSARQESLSLAEYLQFSRFPNDRGQPKYLGSEFLSKKYKLKSSFSK